jgi:hypothetical protein
MADLSKTLPTEIDSQQRFIQAAPATPSPLTAIADFAGNLAGVASDAWTAFDRNAAQRRAAADEQAKNNAVKDIANSIFSDPSVAPKANIPPGSEQAAANVKPLAAQAANSQQAAAQGKIDPAMAQAKSLAVLRQALASNPGHEYAVYQVFKEAGVDNMIMQQYNNAEKALENDQSAQQATTNKLIDSAVNEYGYADYFKRSPSEQAQILATVGNLKAQEADLKTKSTLADLTLKNVQLTDEQRKVVQTQNSSTLFDSANTYLTSNFSNLMKMAVNQLADPSLANQPGRLEQLQSHWLSVALPALDAEYINQKGQLGSLLSSDDANRLDTLYHQQRDALVNLISGPQSVVAAQQRALQTITDTYGIDYAKAAPTLLRLQKLIGPQAVGVLLSPSIQGNKQLMDMLGNELKGVIQDPSKMPSFTEFVQTLNGTIDPSSWNPEKIKAAAPAALISMNALAHNDPATNGTDKQGHLALVNSVKQTASLAVDVVPQWGFGNVLMQGKALNTRGVTTALFNTSANVSDRMDAIRAWIPATTRTYMTLSQMPSGDQYYSAQLDPHTLTWKAVWNGRKVEAPLQKGGMAAGAFSLAEAASPGTYANDLIKPSPSTKVLEQVSTLNHMLNNLSDAGSKGYDPTLGKGVNYQEARKYFATGQIPQSLNKPTTQKNGKTPEQNVDDAISHMLDFVNRLPSPKPVAEVSNMPLAGAVTTSAEKYGVPTDIALRLIHQESGGNPNVGVSKKGAVGPGQIMPTTAARYGADVTKLTPEENVDLAMRILADNHARTGNWEDAVSMYHSGHTLADAARLKLNDGNIATTDYTAGVVGMSSISPDNLKRYGYVRY